MKRILPFFILSLFITACTSPGTSLDDAYDSVVGDSVLSLETTDEDATTPSTVAEPHTPGEETAAVPAPENQLNYYPSLTDNYTYAVYDLDHRLVFDDAYTALDYYEGHPYILLSKDDDRVVVDLRDLTFLSEADLPEGLLTDGQRFEQLDDDAAEKTLAYDFGFYGVLDDFGFGYYDAYANHLSITLYNDEHQQVWPSPLYDIHLISETRLFVGNHLNRWFMTPDGAKIDSDVALNHLTPAAELHFLGHGFIAHLDRDGAESTFVYTVDGELLGSNADPTQGGLMPLGDELYAERHRVIDERFISMVLPRLTFSGDELYLAKANKAIWDKMYHGYETAPVDEQWLIAETDFDLARHGDVLDITFHQYWNGVGAAHPNTSASTMHVDLTTGDMLTGKDLWLDAEKAYKTLTDWVQEKAETTPELYYNPEEIAVDDATNYEHLTDGIRFYYVPYEIGPYAAGYLDFVFSYEDLADLMDEESGYYERLMPRN